MKLKKGNFSLDTNTGETAILVVGGGWALLRVFKPLAEKALDKLRKFKGGKNVVEIEFAQDESKRTSDTDRQR